MLPSVPQALGGAVRPGRSDAVRTAPTPEAAGREGEKKANKKEGTPPATPFLPTEERSRRRTREEDRRGDVEAPLYIL